MLAVGQAIFDIFYPIGTYYETSNTSFNPNKATGWYGTWVEDTKGQTLVSRDSGTFKTVGASVGSETVTLTGKQIPPHIHGFDVKGAILNWDNITSGDYWGHKNKDLNFASSGVVALKELKTSSTGGGQAHNNIQPSKVAIRWHRTA